LSFLPRIDDRLFRLCLTLWASMCCAGSQASAPVTAYADLHWRLVGPFRGGWATAVAGHPEQPAAFYFGSADGGVWTTDDAGVTWRPLFERQGSASIGALTLAPGDPEVIWVGTGQIQQRWDIVDGDGVYRSTDGGKSWKHLGLADTRHIGALWVDPRNADTAVVAALGHVFGPNEQRGVFRTEDGGAEWTRVLYLDDTTGAADLAYSADTPDVLYASMWQVQGHPWLDYFQPTVGQNSGIYRSDDGGRSWYAVAGAGLPPAPLGRIEMAVAPGRAAMRVWASVQTATGGALYRSEDGGGHWQMVNSDSTLASSYMGWLTADPQNPEVVWAGGQPLRRSDDAGVTFKIIRSSPGGDDYHALWIDPGNPRRMIAGADQGAVVTFNGGKSWSSWYNQPTGQFYRLAVDNGFPYRIYSGQQDSGTVSIASRSDYGRISFRDWHPVGGDERDGDVPDPVHPDIVYGAGLGGRISRWNARTGQVQNVSPWPLSSYAENPLKVKYRYDWITPLAISPVPPHALYAAAQVVFRSQDGGKHWRIISGDLTGSETDAAGCSENVALARATACGFATVFAIAPSPMREGLAWVGTTNGRVYLTTGDGEHWFDVTPSGLEDWSGINMIDASPSDPDTAYIAVDRHRLDDFMPRAYVTHNAGSSWREIGHGLPPGAYVKVVREDPAFPGLLYAGTSRGVHVSFDDGENWQSLQLDLPTTGVNDLLVHDDDLIVATQGRAIWILDRLTPLRHIAQAAPGPLPELVAPGQVVRLRFNQNKDMPLPPEEPTGDNPPVGAVLDYILPADFSGPVRLEIRSEDGSLVRGFDSEGTPTAAQARVYVADIWRGDPRPLAATPGHHRFVWNLRYAPPPTLNAEYSIAAVPGRPTPVLPQGAFVLPGSYTVTLHAGGTSVSQPLTVAMDPRVKVPPQELSSLLAFQQRLEELLRQSVSLFGGAAGGSENGGSSTEETALRSVVKDLTALAIDLERSDAPPTLAQRELLDHLADRLEVTTATE